MNDYRVNKSYRTTFRGSGDPVIDDSLTFSLNDDESSFATHLYLMGDGSTDTNSIIYNQVHPSGNANLTLNNISETTDISIN
jgi:hypothetical protein